MLSFYKFYEKLNLLESKISEDALWKYYYHIAENPNLDDLKTFFKMMEKKYSDVRMTGLLNDFLGGITHKIIPKLSVADQEEAKKTIENLKLHPEDNHTLIRLGHKKFDNFHEFEEYISNSIESNYPSMAAKVAMRPEYEYWWEMISNDMKKAFHKALITEKKRQDSQPNIGDMIRNAIRGKPEEDGSKGWDSV